MKYSFLVGIFLFLSILTTNSNAQIITMNNNTAYTLFEQLIIENVNVINHSFIPLFPQVLTASNHSTDNIATSIGDPPLLLSFKQSNVHNHTLASLFNRRTIQ